MVDLAKIKACIAALPEPGDEAPVTRRCLEQILAELTAGRASQRHDGATFARTGRSL